MHIRAIDAIITMLSTDIRRTKYRTSIKDTIDGRGDNVS